ncbi:PLP-dependent cysteine synthase family protein [Pontibacillus litoralis]|uniref:Cysteine synthase n=1 Tax=Pontibacillus litoralis JSM 072002 TaxID=1385512 RepID=A0A0A5GAT8_9BACI|nr:cysteine synthase family protein [Pontibacillus litoralis]KGX88230.1 cysteine synthase [Pontibacillus litoralis JSM 072002]
MNYVTDVQQLIGHTPLIELTHIHVPENIRIFAKLEYLNPGGSVKDRLGQSLIQHGVATGKLKPGGTIIEPTAGNTGIGIALAAVGQEFNVLFVTPEKFSVEKQLLMRALGAEVINTPTEEGMEGAIRKSKQLMGEIPNAYCPQQFASEANPSTYYKTLAPEIYEALAGQVDIFVAGGGTGGTFMGCARYFKEHNESTRTVIVEPEGSILNGGAPTSHRTEGIGMEFIPPFMDRRYFDGIHTIKDEQAFAAVKQLALKEGLLVGSSSGAAFVAAMKEAQMAPPGTTIVTIFPDGSERYLSQHIYEE